jgi:AcrR family transcriptional regulator
MPGQLAREDIYSAAISVFARYGFKRTRVEDIAGELGVVSGTLYRYVSGKRELYEQAVAYGITLWQTKVKESVSQKEDVIEQFSTMCEKGYQYLADDRDMRRILMDDPSIFPLSPRKVRFPGIDTGSLDLIRQILEKGISQGIFREVDVDHSAEFLYSVYVMFIIKTYVKSEGRSASQMYAQGIDMILNGLVLQDRPNP